MRVGHGGSSTGLNRFLVGLGIVCLVLAAATVGNFLAYLHH